MSGSERRERKGERRIVLPGTDGDEKDRIGIEAKRQSRRASLTCTTRSPRHESLYCLDSPCSARTGRLILSGGNSGGGGDPIAEKAGNDSLFRAQGPQDQRQPRWEFSLDSGLVRGKGSTV